MLTVIVGESGNGKTTLADELLRRMVTERVRLAAAKGLIITHDVVQYL